MAQARRVSGSRVGKGTVRSANPRIGTVRGAGARGTMAGIVGTNATNKLAGNMAFGRGFHKGRRLKSSLRSNAIKHGTLVGRGISGAARSDIGTLGGAVTHSAIIGAGALGVGALVERQHAKKALTAKQLQQRRMAAKSKRTPRSGRV